MPVKRSTTPRVRTKRSTTSSRLSSRRSSTSTKGAVGVSLAGEHKRVVPMRVGLHQTSSFLLKLKPEHSAPPPSAPAVTLPSLSPVSRHWFHELSVLSAIGGAVLIGTHIAEYIFRIPINRGDEAGQALSRLGHLRTWLRHTDWSRPVGSVGSTVVAAPVVIKRSTSVLTKLPRPKKVVPKVAVSWKLQTPPRLGLRITGVAVASMVILAPVWLMGGAVGAFGIKADIVDAASSAVASLADGSTALQQQNLDEAVAKFSLASQDFSLGIEAIEQLPGTLRLFAGFIPGGSKVASAEHLLVAGRAVSGSAEQIASLLKATPMTDAASTWRVVRQMSETMLPVLRRVEGELSQVNAGDIPPEQRATFDKLRATLPTVRGVVEHITGLASADVMGDESPRRYLLLFQNNHELRPSGGFLGSLAIIEVRKGVAQILRFPGGGTYDAQGSLLLRNQAPAPLQLVNPRWELQDTNWSPDFPTTAETVARYFRFAGNESVDGVIAIDASVVEKLLALTGPIPMPAYETTLTAENFVEETQHQVEIKYDKIENKPKQFLADMAPLLGERLQKLLAEQPAAFLEVLSASVNEKHLLVWLANSEAEQHVDALGLAGKLGPLPPYTDGLAVVHANIAGGKTDTVVKTSVDHQVVLGTDGALAETVTMTREHTGSKGNQFTGVRNVDYVRFYVPLGSMLSDASGFTPPDAKFFQPVSPDLGVDPSLRAIQTTHRVGPGGVDITEELGRTVFGGWVMVDPGGTATVRLSYTLPWRLTTQPARWQSWAAQLGWARDATTYHFVLAKQPGVMSTNFRHQFTSVTPLTIDTHSPNVTADSSGWHYEDVVSTDRTLQITFRGDN